MKQMILDSPITIIQGKHDTHENPDVDWRDKNSLFAKNRIFKWDIALVFEDALEEGKTKGSKYVHTN